MAFLRTVGWILCVVYSTVPLFWIVIHPNIAWWRRRKKQGHPAYKAVLPLWVGMWICIGAVSWPWRNLFLYRTPLAWIAGVLLIFSGLFLYSRGRQGFSPLQFSGQHEIQIQALDKTINSGPICKIAGVTFEGSLPRQDFPFHFASVRLQRPADAYDIRSGFRQGQSKSFPNASTAAGYQRSFSLQSESVQNRHGFSIFWALFTTLNEDLHDLSARFQTFKCGLDRFKRRDLTDQSVERQHSRSGQRDGLLEILRFINPCPQQAQLPPKKAEKVNLGGGAENGDEDYSPPYPRQLGHSLGACGRARNLKHHVGPRRFRLIIHIFDRINLLGIQRIETQFTRQVQPERIYFHQCHSCSGVPGYKSDQDADGASALNHCVFSTFNFCQAHIVVSDGHRLNQGRLFKRQGFRQSMECMSWHCPEGLEGSRRVKANKFQALADMRITSAACRAYPARVEGADGNMITRSKALNPFADGMNRARHLMPEYVRNLETMVHRAVEHVQIAAADATVRNFNLYLPRRRVYRFAFTHSHSPMTFVISCLQHL